MEKTRIKEILLYFESSEKIANSFLLSKKITQDEINELLASGYIQFISLVQTNIIVFKEDKQYIITPSGIQLRNN